MLTHFLFLSCPGLPVQVRDSVNADLEDQTAVVTDVTREWLANQAEIKLRDGISNQNAAPNAVSASYLSSFSMSTHQSISNHFVCRLVHLTSDNN